MNQKEIFHFIEKLWDESIVPTLMEYIKIPNKSPQFDPQWEKNGYMEEAVELIATWCSSVALPNTKVEVIRLPQRTPLLLMEIPGASDETILLYGHLDKQPEMSGWDPDLGPWKPVQRENRLYGRGAADDGYAAFASLAAILALHQQQIPHARCVILIEACEESGSYDLPFYIDALKARIGNPSLIICLDSGCGNYNQLWITTSLRGLIGGALSIDILKQGIHSGLGSGIVPSPFRILRLLLNRIEDCTNGNIILKELQVPIPEIRRQQAVQAAGVLEHTFIHDLPLVEAVKPESDSIVELILRRTWYPMLSVIGMQGMPSIENAGNVTLPALAVKLSMRLPPTCDPRQAAQVLKNTLEKNPPYDAIVNFEIQEEGLGWNAPNDDAWLIKAANGASLDYFGEKTVYLGEGGSIPFMGMLGEKFPQAQFLITGVLGPGSNAHGPNEFLDIPTGKKVTACVAQVIADHFKR